MAPSVFAAYTPPTSRAGSWPREATAASARGKLAPHSTAGGRTAQRHRSRSSWMRYHGLDVSSGRSASKGATARSWPRSRQWRRQEPLRSAQREPGRRPPPCQERPGAAADPQSDQKRGQNQRKGVHCPPQYQRQQPGPDHLGPQRRHSGKCDRQVDAQAPAVRPAFAPASGCAVGSYGATAARARAITATVALTATATKVAVAMS